MTVTAPVDLLRVTTVRIDDPGPLLGLLPASGALAWVRDGQGLVGWGETARLEVRGDAPFDEAAAWWSDLVRRTAVADEVGLPGTGMLAFGSFAFDSVLGRSLLVVPEIVVGRQGDCWWATSITTGAARERATTLPRQSARPAAPGRVHLAPGAVTEDEWMRAVDDVLACIGAGEADKVVLARDVLALTENPLDVRWPLGRLAADYPSCWTFAVDGLLGATPELLIGLRDGAVSSRVLAGTLRHAADTRASTLTGSLKDLAEHRYAVDSVAAALVRHCRDVEVPAEPSVLHLRNVLHLATEVTGRLVDDVSSLDLVAALHPSAAVCGTPTAAAMRVIRRTERMDRGRYAGPVGWMDAAGDGEWGIALRCAELDPDDPRKLRLFAGCGIVAGSEPQSELEESAAKLIPMCDALRA